MSGVGQQLDLFAGSGEARLIELRAVLGCSRGYTRRTGPHTERAARAGAIDL
ncbi:hypothetical protein [Metallibacterium scheffleri]|uniref:hypothetical protein n=1 Tax=Metallibacterium scheffleri TaxID=993689 RepID=UPI001445FDB9|nr:hypothetical protein [Metallibacterium scheffleri]